MAYAAIAPMGMAYYAAMPPSTPLNTGSIPYMPGAAPQPQPQPPAPSPVDRQKLKVQVQAQLEYYFSQDNLIKDVYLRSRMNEEGWISVECIAGFRRVQQMTTDTGMIMDAIKESKKLEMDPTNTQVRLHNEWQNWLLSPGAKSGGAASPGAQGAQAFRG
jgi:la-related protein 1